MYAKIKVQLKKQQKGWTALKWHLRQKNRNPKTTENIQKSPEWCISTQNIPVRWLIRKDHNTVNNVHVVDFLNNRKSLLNSFAWLNLDFFLSHGKPQWAMKLYYSLVLIKWLDSNSSRSKGKRIIDVFKIITPCQIKTGSSEPKPAKVIYHYQEILVMKSTSKWL